MFRLQIRQKTIKLFMKECILNEDDIFIILDKKEYLRYFDILPLLMNNSNLFVFLYLYFLLYIILIIGQ